METEINVAATLKDKPQGVKLYSRICGAVELKEVLDVRKKKSIVVKELNSSNQHRFWYDGKFFRAGQCVLQPSKEMADWSKFSWKKGDVLVCKDVNSHIIFEKFNDDTYTTFTGKLYYQATRAGYSYTHTRNLAMTQDFDIEEGDAVQTYIKTIEERLGGKLNRKTLEIEKAQPEFKDGDIVVYGKSVAICRKICKHTLFPYVSIDETSRLLFNDNPNVSPDECRFAKEEEKQQLFDALAKEGKVWDSDKKQIVDLPKKCEFKPMDWCLMRGGKEHFVSDWTLCQFSHKMECGKYRAVGGCAYDECIPYNDQTKHLLGTTDEWKGGEG